MSRLPVSVVRFENLWLSAEDCGPRLAEIGKLKNTPWQLMTEKDIS
jgi:hypothetical protein